MWLDAQQIRAALYSPPLIDFCFIGGILPWPPAVASERWQRPHGVSWDGGRSRHVCDTVQLLFLLSQASEFTLSSLHSHHARAAPIQAAPVLGLCKAHRGWEGQGRVATQGWVPLQGHGVISRGAGAGDISRRLFLFRLLQGRKRKMSLYLCVIAQQLLFSLNLLSATGAQSCQRCPRC